MDGTDPWLECKLCISTIISRYTSDCFIESSRLSDVLDLKYLHMGGIFLVSMIQESSRMIFRPRSASKIIPFGKDLEAEDGSYVSIDPGNQNSFTIFFWVF